MNPRLALFVLTILALLAGCAPAAPTPRAAGSPPRVIATESFLSDIAQNVAGDRLKVETLVPIGVDPHGFEPTPRDVARVAESDVVIVNGHGFEGYLDGLIASTGGERKVVEASAGLTPRTPQAGERVEAEHTAEHPEGDPHFWLDPTLAVRYVENIRAGLSAADPAGAGVYAANAAAYGARLLDLDREIAERVSVIPPERRLLVTNHESFGYYADRYGFRIVGTVIPSVSTDASPSAREMAALVDQIRQSGARAIFLETGSSETLARQISQETGVKVVTGLYTHSTSEPGGPAPTYVDMLLFDTKAIVDALR